MTLHRSVLLSLGFLSIVATIGCATPQPPPPPVDTSAADAAAIRKADEDWSAAAQTRQVAAWTAYYADDAVVLPPNQPAATSKESIAKAVGDLLKLPALTMTWTPVKVEAARSGDIGYVRGTYQLAFKNAKGKRVADHGKYVEVWRKQADGSWKCIIDTWSSDLP